MLAIEPILRLFEEQGTDTSAVIDYLNHCFPKDATPISEVERPDASEPR
jgi:hypothetical protein